MVYVIQHPFTGKMLYPSNNACWRYQQSQMLEYMQGWCDYELRDLGDAKERAAICGVAEGEVRQGVQAIVLSESLEISAQKAQAVYNRGQWPRFYFTRKGKGGIRRKTYLENLGDKVPTNFWPYLETGHTDEAKKEVLAIFEGKASFDTPKPHRLIEYVLKVAEYVGRVIQNMTQDELAAMKTAIPTYGAKILAKIESLEKAYRHKTFKQWLESDKIICMPSYKLPMVITPAKTIDSIPYSLYEAEKEDMNGFERTVIDIIASMDNIRWWHRNIERKGFCLNGYINHYPDFLVMTKAGRLVLVETKGDYLDGDDSKAKLELGRKWQEKAGNKYRYYMVFDKKALDMDGAFTLDKFAEIMKEL